MINVRFALLTLLTLVASTTFAGADDIATFTRPADPWPGPQGAFVYSEGEDFTIEGEGWQVEDVRRDRNGHNTAAGMAVLSGRHKGNGTAHRQMRIDEDGDYKLWINLSRWPDDSDRHRAPVRATIEQNGQVVLEQVFDETWDAPKQPGRFHVAPLMWVTPDEKVSLKAGVVTLRLAKVGRESIPLGSARRVDCVLLTTDDAYEPNERDFVPQTYLRFDVRSASIDAGYFEFFCTYLRKPWFKHFSVDTNGARDGLAAKKDAFFTTGQKTGWANISRYLYNDSPAKMMVRYTAQYSYKDAEASDYALSFAPVPEESAILKTVERAGEGAFMRLIVPSDLASGEVPTADYEYAAQRAAMVAKLPKITFGRVAEKFPLDTARPGNREQTSPGVADTELQTLKYLGTNSINGMLDDKDIAAGMQFSTSHQRMWFMGPALYNEPDLDKLETHIESGAKHFAEHPHRDRVVSLGLMDEACAKPLSSMVGNKVDEAAFRVWLDKQGVTAKQLGVATDKDIHLVGDRDTDVPALYYWSQKFRAWSVANFFRLATDTIAKHYPPGAAALTTQNYSDGAVYMANMFNQGNDYFTWFKEVQAMGIAMSEDWTNHGATWQLCGWNVNLLRSATKYHRQPIHMFVISSFGRRPIDVKLKAYSDLAQGAKLLRFYAYTPQYATNSSVFGERPEMFVAIGELTREIGAVEHILLDAMPRKARTAILYSRPYDIWNEGHDNSLGHERMFTYLALRHAQVPVDVISDDDVFEGGLDGYDVVYAFGEQIDARAIQPLTNWVKAGGRLVLSPGAISRDELNQPTDALDRALSLKRGEVAVLQSFHHSSKYACMLLKPKGIAILPGEEATQVGLLARSQTFDLPTHAQTMATFDDGSAASARVDAGKGQVYLTGFMPAIAYMQQAYQHYAVGREIDQATAGPFNEEDMTTKTATGPAGEQKVRPLRNVALAMAATSDDPEHRDAEAIRIPRQEYSYCPFAYPAALRDLIVAPVRDAAMTLPVAVDQPVVEATFMESDKGFVIPLANYTGGPLDTITVTLAPGRACGDIYSSREGKRVATQIGDRLQVTIPLESTDFLYATWQ